MQTENEQGLLRRSDALTLEEIQASTDLSGKIASASSVNELSSTTTLFSGKVTTSNTYTIPDISSFKLIEITNDYYGNVLFSFVHKPEINATFVISNRDIYNENAIQILVIFTDNNTLKISGILTKGSWIVEKLIIRGYK